MNHVRAVLVALWVGWVGTVAWAQACVKTVRWFEDLPYAYQDAQGEMRGFDVEIVRTALRDMGCRAQWVHMPWARGLVELKAGRLDILPGAYRRPDREEFAYFSRPVIRSRNVLFVRRAVLNRYPIRQLADLLGTDFRLGAQIDAAYGPSYDALLNKPEFRARITQVNASRNAWQMMERDRLDGMISDEISGLMELDELGLRERVVKTRLVVSEEPSRIAFGKRTVDRAFVQAFDNALQSMLSDGRYLEIAQRHLPCAVSVEKLGCK